MKRTQLQPDIQYLLDTFTENLKTNLNCIQVGQIVKFYPENKTVDVNICFKQKVNGEIKNYPLLLKCPVLGNKITIPIEKGEFCIVLFNDRNIDSWWETGQAQLPRTNDKHNISDGIVICGLNSLANAIQYDNSAICLNYQQTKINGNLEVNGNTEINGNLKTFGSVDLGGNGGKPIARVGDKIQVVITSGSSAGTWEGTITSGSDNTKSI